MPLRLRRAVRTTLSNIFLSLGLLGLWSLRRLMKGADLEMKWIKKKSACRSFKPSLLKLCSMTRQKKRFFIHFLLPTCYRVFGSSDKNYFSTSMHWLLERKLRFLQSWWEDSGTKSWTTKLLINGGCGFDALHFHVAISFPSLSFLILFTFLRIHSHLGFLHSTPRSHGLMVRTPRFNTIFSQWFSDRV